MLSNLCIKRAFQLVKWERKEPSRLAHSIFMFVIIFTVLIVSLQKSQWAPQNFLGAFQSLKSKLKLTIRLRAYQNGKAILLEREYIVSRIL